MADQPKYPQELVDKSVAEFQALATHDEQCAYYHAHPEIQHIIRGLHFPKPEAKATT
jgi:hypothetical protein